MSDGMMKERIKRESWQVAATSSKQTEREQDIPYLDLCGSRGCLSCEGLACSTDLLKRVSFPASLMLWYNSRPSVHIHMSFFPMG